MDMLSIQKCGQCKNEDNQEWAYIGCSTKYEKTYGLWMNQKLKNYEHFFPKQIVIKNISQIDWWWVFKKMSLKLIGGGY